jgi:hypothetical protein
MFILLVSSVPWLPSVFILSDGNASPVCQQTRCFLQSGPQLRQSKHCDTAMRVAEPHLLAAPQERLVHVLVCNAPKSALRTPAKC